MQHRHLKTFLAVASTLNFTRTAERLHLAQSSVTEQIQTLEADLGTPLFDRSRRRLSLTPAGRRLLDYASGILTLADEARAAVAETANAVTGRLKIGGLETLCATRLPELLAKFQSRHPGVEVSLKTGNSGELRGGVRAGTLDVCFVFGDAPTEPDLRSEQPATEELVVIAPPNHRLNGRETVEAGDLVEEPFLVTEQGCVYRRMFERAFAATGPVRPRVVGEVTSLAAIRGLVKAGIGCALIPRLAASEDIASGAVAALPWIGVHRTVPITVVWRRRRAQSPVLRLFLAAARDDLGTSYTSR